MQFHGGFGLAEVRPGEHGQTQVDGGAVEGIDRIVEFQPQVFVGIQGSGQANQGVGEVGVEAPVALLVGVGKGIAGHAAAQPHVIEFIPVRPQADLDSAQTLAVSELGECHTEKLVEAGKGFDVPIAVITVHATAEGFHGQMGHDLGKDELTGRHDGSSW